MDLKTAETRTCSAYHGWAELGFNSKSKEVKKSGSDPELHVSVRVEPDPRFVFEFDGEPECSPQVFLVKGNDKQAVFTSKFGLRNSGDRNLSRSVIFNLSTLSYVFGLDRFFRLSNSSKKKEFWFKSVC